LTLKVDAALGGLAVLDWKNDVFAVARRDDDDPADRVAAGVPNGVCDSPRHEDEAASGHLDLAVPEQERRFATGETERLIGSRVDVRRRRGLTGREQHRRELRKLPPPPLGRIGWVLHHRTGG
jgi:hypothetical protein